MMMTHELAGFPHKISRDPYLHLSIRDCFKSVNQIICIKTAQNSAIFPTAICTFYALFINKDKRKQHHQSNHCTREPPQNVQTYFALSHKLFTVGYADSCENSSIDSQTKLVSPLNRHIRASR